MLRGNILAELISDAVSTILVQHLLPEVKGRLQRVRPHDSSGWLGKGELRALRKLQREATPSRYVFTTKPGLTHEGLRSYAWVHFRRDCGSRTLLDPAKDETSEPPVDLRRDKTGLSVSPGSKPQQ